MSGTTDLMIEINSLDEPWRTKTLEEWGRRLSEPTIQREQELEIGRRAQEREQRKEDAKKRQLELRMQIPWLSTFTKRVLLKQWLEYIDLDKRKEEAAKWESYWTKR